MKNVQKGKKLSAVETKSVKGGASTPAEIKAAQKLVNYVMAKIIITS